MTARTYNVVEGACLLAFATAALPVVVTGCVLGVAVLGMSALLDWAHERSERA